MRCHSTCTYRYHSLSKLIPSAEQHLSSDACFCVSWLIIIACDLRLGTVRPPEQHCRRGCIPARPAASEPNNSRQVPMFSHCSAYPSPNPALLRRTAAKCPHLPRCSALSLLIQPCAGAQLDGPSIQQCIRKYGATFSAGVPTVFSGLLLHCQQEGLDMRPLRRIVIGGAPMSPAMQLAFRKHGVDAIHAWG